MSLYTKIKGKGLGINEAIVIIEHLQNRPKTERKTISIADTAVESQYEKATLEKEILLAKKREALRLPSINSNGSLNINNIAFKIDILKELGLYPTDPHIPGPN